MEDPEETEFAVPELDPALLEELGVSGEDVDSADALRSAEAALDSMSPTDQFFTLANAMEESPGAMQVAEAISGPDHAPDPSADDWIRQIGMEAAAAEASNAYERPHELSDAGERQGLLQGALQEMGHVVTQLGDHLGLHEPHPEETVAAFETASEAAQTAPPPGERPSTEPPQVEPASAKAASAEPAPAEPAPAESGSVEPPSAPPADDAGGADPNEKLKEKLDEQKEVMDSVQAMQAAAHDTAMTINRNITL